MYEFGSFEYKVRKLENEAFSLIGITVLESVIKITTRSSSTSQTTAPGDEFQF